MADFLYEDMLPIGPDETTYRLVTTEGINAISTIVAKPRL